MWDLSSPSRDPTQAPALEVQSLNHCATREIPDQPTLPVLRLLLTDVDREVDGERVFL